MQLGIALEGYNQVIQHKKYLNPEHLKYSFAPGQNTDVVQHYNAYSTVIRSQVALATRWIRRCLAFSPRSCFGPSCDLILFYFSLFFSVFTTLWSIAPIRFLPFPPTPRTPLLPPREHRLISNDLPNLVNRNQEPSLHQEALPVTHLQQPKRRLLPVPDSVEQRNSSQSLHIWQMTCVISSLFCSRPCFHTNHHVTLSSAVLVILFRPMLPVILTAPQMCRL